MKIYGPYINNCNRQFVIVKTETSCCTKSYPRFLMEQKLGRPLKNYEDVHHIDGDFTNNDLSNLEVKIHGEHQREHSTKLPLTITQVCCECGEEFVLTSEQRNKLSQGRLRRFFCSRRCAGIRGRREQLSQK